MALLPLLLMEAGLPLLAVFVEAIRFCLLALFCRVVDRSWGFFERVFVLFFVLWLAKLQVNSSHN